MNRTYHKQQDSSLKQQDLPQTTTGLTTKQQQDLSSKTTGPTTNNNSNHLQTTGSITNKQQTRYKQQDPTTNNRTYHKQQDLPQTTGPTTNNRTYHKQQQDLPQTTTGPTTNNRTCHKQQQDLPQTTTGPATNTSKTAPEGGMNIRAPGAFHQDKWMAKAIYDLKIFLFREQFTLTAHEMLAVRNLSLFISLFFTSAERGIALITQFNSSITKDETQYLLIVAQDRKDVPSMSKAVFLK
ncbi:hypothetical protein Hamer_G021356 [Homarus americanus]|uniref:Uncharacterized protein n=1 Tax=Homarus americanus TaxID=6706 RepID=A0A8J5TK96_HOMAM|nr:hypothetical protein Hamer_G021356 [Homarus americanus]